LRSERAWKPALPGGLHPSPVTLHLSPFTLHPSPFTPIAIHLTASFFDGDSSFSYGFGIGLFRLGVARRTALLALRPGRFRGRARCFDASPWSRGRGGVGAFAFAVRSPEGESVACVADGPGGGTGIDERD